MQLTHLTAKFSFELKQTPKKFLFFFKNMFMFIGNKKSLSTPETKTGK
jgi:hypothetical protein